MRLLFSLLICLLGLGAIPAAAHEVRPAFLDIQQTDATHYHVIWKQPAMGDRALHLVPHLSNGWLDRRPSGEFADPSFLIKTWDIVTTKKKPLDGQIVRIEGLDQTMTDVLVRVSLLGGTHLSSVVRPANASVQLRFDRHDGMALPAYLELGIFHILTGIDHLMFVLGLLLLVGIRWRLIKAITAFTVAHSITLGISAIGLVYVPSAVIEALVALSIVFVAWELAHASRGDGGLTQKLPWLIAFTFGLLHGFAFASALAEVGLPPDAVPLSLFLFNAGVEIGQLIFVGAALVSILAIQRIAPYVPRLWRTIGAQVPTYAIGSFAAFWFIQRALIALG